MAVLPGYVADHPERDMLRLYAMATDIKLVRASVPAGTEVIQLRANVVTPEIAAKAYLDLGALLAESSRLVAEHAPRDGASAMLERIVAELDAAAREVADGEPPSEAKRAERLHLLEDAKEQLQQHLIVRAESAAYVQAVLRHGSPTGEDFSELAQILRIPRKPTR